MTQLTQGLTNSNTVTISSLEISQFTDKAHDDLLKSIRKMEEAWVNKLGQGKFSESSYKNSQNKTYPCYNFTKSEFLYIISKFSDEIRGRLVLRWEQLEQEKVGFERLEFYQKIDIRSHRYTDFYIYARSQQDWAIPTSQLAALVKLSTSTVNGHAAKLSFVPSEHYYQGKQFRELVVADPAFAHGSDYFLPQGVLELGKQTANSLYTQVANYLTAIPFLLEENPRLLVTKNTKGYKKANSILAFLEDINKIEDEGLRLSLMGKIVRREVCNA